MIRKIIKIDKEKCDGCGACAEACHEGAIEIVDEKAVLVRENFCDGIGDCLPECHAGAITFEKREAPAYDENAVKAAKRDRLKKQGAKPSPSGEPDMQAHHMVHITQDAAKDRHATVSQLGQWPCQIKLVPTNATYFDGAKLLVAADCTAYAYANFHRDFMHGRVTLIGCPKLDSVDYSEKLCEIIKNNDIKSVLVLRMEVPCCGGLEAAVKRALLNSKKAIPWQVVTLTIGGAIQEDLI